MCGILALLGGGHPRVATSRAFESGRHRGPEDSRLVVFGDITFGFHRLGINGYGHASSAQPIEREGCILMCNGEIYNWAELHASLGIPTETRSDCEIVIHLYRRYGIEHALRQLDGVFALVLHDKTNATTFVARDQFGVRPLFEAQTADDADPRGLAFASELKMLAPLGPRTCGQFAPGTCLEIRGGSCTRRPFVLLAPPAHPALTREDALRRVREVFTRAVHKRTANTDRGIACLLSGGVDSSLVAAIVARRLHPQKIHTFSIGMRGSPDLSYARLAADHIGTVHHSIELTEEEFLEVVPDVVASIESDDVTTVRASVGNWLVARHIRSLDSSDLVVVLNGDGADECCGGYVYLAHAPDDLTFDHECKRLLQHIHFYDGLRSDRCISAHGLEARTPFLDRAFVDTYLGIPVEMRRCQPGREKRLLRDAFAGTGLLPDEILYRPKEAFSDGVSQRGEASWHLVLQRHIREKRLAESEAGYYTQLLHGFYGALGQGVVPYKWMPRFVEATDPSARTLAGAHGCDEPARA